MKEFTNSVKLRKSRFMLGFTDFEAQEATTFSDRLLVPLKAQQSYVSPPVTPVIMLADGAIPRHIRAVLVRPARQPCVFNCAINADRESG